ncbi:MAG: hypothetical protein CSH37_13045 [Thalassolituus sp.]|nr:MAG: hypothetical protein CSH37_13045 [Thalassolituus sp.]
MMKTIHLEKERFHFSCAHFTIFSSTNRERLHGHTYRVAANFLVNEADFVDYNLLKDIITRECERLDERIILPSESPFIEYRKRENSLELRYDKDCFLFPEGDVELLPIENTTIECLSSYFAGMVAKRCGSMVKLRSLSLYSGPGQHCTVEF